MSEPEAAAARDVPPPKRRRPLLRLLLLGVVVVVGVGIGAVAGFVIASRIVVGLTLADQKAALTFPDSLSVDVAVTNILDVVLDGTIDASVPVDQEVTLPLKGRYRTELDLSTPVDINMNIVYDGLIPVNTHADITARAPFNFEDVRTFRGIVFNARIPMNLQLPVRFEVPVNQTIDFRYKGEVVAGLDNVVEVPLRTVIDTSLDVNERVSTPVSSTFGMRMRMPDDPQRVIIDHADLRLPLSTLRLEEKPEGGGPERRPSPWGPAAP